MSDDHLIYHRPSSSFCLLKTLMYNLCCLLSLKQMQHEHHNSPATPGEGHPLQCHFLCCLEHTILTQMPSNDEQCVSACPATSRCHTCHQSHSDITSCSTSPVTPTSASLSSISQRFRHKVLDQSKSYLSNPFLRPRGCSGVPSLPLVAAAAGSRQGAFETSPELLPNTCKRLCPVPLQVNPALQASDCACAVSFLWWSQLLAADQQLWDVVGQAGKSLKEQKAKKGGLLFWDLIEKEEWTPPYSVSRNQSKSCTKVTQL